MSEAEHAETVRNRPREIAERMAELEAGRREAFRERLKAFIEPDGDERVLDSGAGTGGFALAVAPLVGEVVAVDAAPEVVAVGREQALPFPNVSLRRWRRHEAAISGRVLRHRGRGAHAPPRPAARARRRRARPRDGLSRARRRHRPDSAYGSDARVRARSLRTRSRRVAHEAAARRRHPLVARCEQSRPPSRGVPPGRTGRRGLPRPRRLRGRGADRALAFAPRGYSATIGWYLAARPQAD